MIEKFLLYIFIYKKLYYLSLFGLVEFFYHLSFYIHIYLAFIYTFIFALISSILKETFCI